MIIGLLRPVVAGGVVKVTGGRDLVRRFETELYVGPAMVLLLVDETGSVFVRRLTIEDDVVAGGGKPLSTVDASSQNGHVDV